MKLGPILGIEDEYQYTVCFLSEREFPQQDLSLTLIMPGDGQEEEHQHSPEEPKKLVDHTFYRFSFPVPEKDEAYSVKYIITVKKPDGSVEKLGNWYWLEKQRPSSQPLSPKNGLTEWEFEVPGKKGLPRIGYCSCNGDSGKHPSDVEPEEFGLWKKMREIHDRSAEDDAPSQKFHCLFMGGDQVYADSIWEKVEFLKNLQAEVEKDAGFFGRIKHRFDNKALRKLTTKSVARFELDKAKSAVFERQLKSFYEQLYIDSWADADMSYMLASVPSVMMWDDHDVFDGWGSHPDELQECDIFQRIFKIGCKYFEIFQIRTKDNQSLIYNRTKRWGRYKHLRDDKGSDHHLVKKARPWKHYSMHLTLRSVEIFVLDNRSFRTRWRVMAESQYKDLEEMLEQPLFKKIPDERHKEKILCFVIPVPVAHLDYAGMAESVLEKIGRNNFRKTISDDAIDHWDHKNHSDEQKRLLDLMFEAGEKRDPYYVCIISGDVHSAGAAKITHNASERSVTQLISSAIVHVPPTWGQGKVLGFVSETLSRVHGYTLDLKNYGEYEEQTINRRNFAYLEKDGGVRAYLKMEGAEEVEPRTLNRFIKPYRERRL